MRKLRYRVAMSLAKAHEVATRRPGMRTRWPGPRATTYDHCALLLVSWDGLLNFRHHCIPLALESAMCNILWLKSQRPGEGNYPSSTHTAFRGSAGFSPWPVFFCAGSFELLIPRSLLRSPEALAHGMGHRHWTLPAIGSESFPWPYTSTAWPILKGVLGTSNSPPNAAPPERTVPRSLLGACCKMQGRWDLMHVGLTWTAFLSA